MFVELVNRLLKTRDNLLDVCEEIGQPLPDEGSLPIMQCVNCYIWRSKDNFVMEDEMPVCHFCADMSLLRF
jgi:hypothetical protein